MTETSEEAFPVSAWLDARGRFNLLSLLFFMPAFMYVKLLGLGQGSPQALASFNRTGLCVIAATWLICLVWDQVSWARRGGYRGQAWARLRHYLWHNLPGLLLTLMFLADLAYWPVYLGTIMLVFALGNLTRPGPAAPKPTELRPVGPLYKTEPLPPFKRKYLVLSAVIWIVSFAWGFSQQGKRPGPERRDLVATRSNMRELQTLLELYHTDANRYPESLSKLQGVDKLSEQREWSRIKNYLDGQTGYGRAYLDYSAYQRDYRPATRQVWPESVLGIYLGPDRPRSQSPSFGGLVLYQYLAPNNYRLYGTDSQGALILEQDKALTLHP